MTEQFLDPLILTATGLLSGLLAGLLGIGGGTVLVPILVALGHSPLQAVATSSLCIVITSLSGSIQNWRMGLLPWQPVIFLGIPALVTAQGGVIAAQILPDRWLLLGFGLLLLSNIYLMELRKHVEHTAKHQEEPEVQAWHPALARLITGGIAGLLAGLFGVGGGIILVPLQMVLLAQPIKTAIQTSLGVIMMTAIAATIGHSGFWPWLGNHLETWLGQGQASWVIESHVQWSVGLWLGLGGLVGAQFSTRWLPALDDRTVQFLFRSLLATLGCYTLTQALWGG